MVGLFVLGRVTYQHKGLLENNFPSERDRFHVGGHEGFWVYRKPFKMSKRGNGQVVKHQPALVKPFQVFVLRASRFYGLLCGLCLFLA